MNEEIKQRADTNSAEFNQGVEAGLNSEENTNNWKAGNELGQALKDEGDDKALSDVSLDQEHPTALFMTNSPEGIQGNAQDEKDESEE